MYIDSCSDSRGAGFAYCTTQNCGRKKSYSAPKLCKLGDNATARELRSAEEILIAQSNGELEIARTNILINSPTIQHR